jgi:hypothetical protein
MDYCYACRRHLNGAYSCPGCATPADQLAPPGTANDHTVQLPVVTDTGEDAPGEAYPEDCADLPPGGGRAARRGAAKVGRGRRRVAAYGVGAVAVVGALTMFSMAAMSGGVSGGAEEPLPELTNASPDPTASEPSPGDGGVPTSTPADGHGSASPSGSPSPSATSAPTTSAPRTPATSGPVATATGTVAPSATTVPATSGSPSPAPTRTSKKQCKPVLWWCE